MENNQFPLVIWGATDPGQQREGNEDSIFPESGAEFYKPSESNVAQKGRLLVVADGMGGVRGGSESSRWAIRAAVERYYDLGGPMLDMNLKQAVYEANKSLFQYLQSTGVQGAGCTMVGAVIYNNKLHVANVGDSRAYLIRNGTITQLTRDHTVTQDKIERGLLTPDQAAMDPDRNVITRSMGTHPEVVVDLFEPMPLAQGDVVLLCSDGLTDMLDDPDILRQVGGNAPQKAAKRLIDAANKAGGIDNISVVLAQVGGKPAPAVKGPQGPGVFDRLGKLSGKQWGLILGLLALVLLVVGGVAWAISRTPQSSLPSSTRQPSVNDPTVTLSSPGSQATPDPDTQTSSGGKATSTPLPSPTPLPPTATRDPNRPTPKPGETLPSTSNRLITMNSPTLGEIYENPIGFSWTAELRTGEAYQVTVRHTETGHVIYSGTQQEENWLQTLPLDKTGEWWWKVDIVKGQDTVASSQEIRFILTTDIGSGDNGGGGGGGGGSDCHTEEYECNCSTDLSGKKTCETCTREVCE